MRRVYNIDGTVKLAGTSTVVDMVVDCELAIGVDQADSEAFVTHIYVDGLDWNGKSQRNYLYSARPMDSGLNWLMSDKDVMKVADHINELVAGGNHGVEA